MRQRLTVFCIGLLFLTIHSLEAKDTKVLPSDLWGLWTEANPYNPSDFHVDTMIVGFYPSNQFYLPGFEYLSTGTYSINGQTLNLEGKSIDPSGSSSPFSYKFGYMLAGNQLTLHDPRDFSISLTKVADYGYTRSQPCNEAIPSHIRTSYLARVPFEGGKATNLREKPSTTSQLIQRMPLGTSFYVIGGPQCSEGYTWWQLWIAGNSVGWAAEGNSDGYFIEPTLPLSIKSSDEINKSDLSDFLAPDFSDSPTSEQSAQLVQELFIKGAPFYVSDAQNQLVFAAGKFLKQNSTGLQLIFNFAFIYNLDETLKKSKIEKAGSIVCFIIGLGSNQGNNTIDKLDVACVWFGMVTGDPMSWAQAALSPNTYIDIALDPINDTVGHFPIACYVAKVTKTDIDICPSLK
jgi:hypothetical protein